MSKMIVSVDERGIKEWLTNGETIPLKNGKHNVELPNGTKKWYSYDVLHRLDGPAIEYADGTQEWYFNDKLHRLDGPAIKNEHYEMWVFNGLYHRLDGPAYIEYDRVKKYYIDYFEFTKQEFEEIISTGTSKDCIWLQTYDFVDGHLHSKTKKVERCRYNSNGQFHCEDGPAIIDNDGEFWYFNGEYHREDGPAITLKNGKTFHYNHGEFVK